MIIKKVIEWFRPNEYYTRAQKIQVVAINAGFVLATLVLFLIAYWLFAPYDVIDVKGDYKTAKTVYTQGDKTTYTVSYCKYINAPAAVTKEFIDGIIYTADSPQAHLGTGCRSQEVALTIPESLPPGDYRIRNTIAYQVNPFRTVTYTHYSNWFTVGRSGEGSYGDGTVINGQVTD